PVQDVMLIDNSIQHSSDKNTNSSSESQNMELPSVVDFVTLVNDIEILQKKVELSAIHLPIKWTTEKYNNKLINIITDSASAIAFLNKKSLHPIADSIIYSSNNKYHISWMCSHQGIVGNEHADSLAKAACSNCTLPIAYDKISIHTLKSILWEDLIQDWQSEWDQHRESITFFPSISEALKFTWFTPNHHVIQFLMNHGCFSSYLQRFIGTPTNLCTFCNTEDNAKQYLFECLMLDAECLEIRTIVQANNIQCPCTCDNLINNKTVYYYFKQLINEYHILRSSTVNPTANQ
ncbi:uncharacterized protein LOC111616748, partial [Centruroides sculpturatus]|uniref:uncharacterized protein LOC111616748 n=1 Tax=Centruroides sculpturatus TaxID=218467 RepID=UPI000C6D4870